MLVLLGLTLGACAGHQPTPNQPGLCPAGGTITIANPLQVPLEVYPGEEFNAPTGRLAMLDPHQTAILMVPPTGLTYRVLVDGRLEGLNAMQRRLIQQESRCH